MTTMASAVALERMAAQNAWEFYLKAAQIDARLGEWEESTTEAGVLLSARVEGPAAADAIEGAAMASGAWMDYSDPDRLACSWQSNGVWVELWCPALAPTSPAPAPAPVVPPQPKRRLLAGLGDRLPYTRRNKTPKENQPA